MLIKKKRLIVLVTLLSALCMCVASLFVVNTVKASTTPTTASFKMFDGAWFRATGADQTSGMRFAGTISSSEYTALETAYGSKYLEFGVLLCRAEDISSESELEIGSATLTEYDSATGIENGKKYYQRKAVMPQVDETDKNENGDTTEYAFYGSFIGIKEQNFNKNFVAKAYVAFGEDENTRTIEYTNAVSRSIFTVANAGLIGDYAGNAYCQNVYNTVTEGYTNLKIETTVNGSIADPATDSVAMGDKVGVTAKLYDAANQNFIEVQGKYEYTTLTSDNADGTVSVKTLKGLSYEAKVPNFDKQVVTLTPKADQVYTASIDDLNTIFKTTEGGKNSHNNVTIGGITYLNGTDNPAYADCDAETPTFTNEVGDEAPTGAEYKLHYNVLRTDDNKIASNYCKGYFEIDNSVYNVGDYVTIDIYYSGVSCALFVSGVNGGSQAVQLRNAETTGSASGTNFSVLALDKTAGILKKPSSAASFGNVWLTYEFQILGDAPIKFYTSNTSAGAPDTYYFANIRISDQRVMDRKEIANDGTQIKISGTKTTGTITDIKNSDSELVEADYKVSISGSERLYIKPAGLAVGDTLTFKYYNAAGNTLMNYRDGQNYESVASGYVTEKTCFYSNGDRYITRIYDEDGNLVDFNNSGTKYDNQWLTFKVEYLSKDYADYEIKDAGSGNTFYFKDIQLIKKLG